MAQAGGAFHPRVGNALGLIPPVNAEGEFNTQPTDEGVSVPLVYHGGVVMAGGITVHTIFWAPSGYAFQGSPAGAPTYEQTIENFFTDVAANSESKSECNGPSAECNIFSTLTEYAEGTKPGHITSGDYKIAYGPADSIKDSKPYPASKACSSPLNARACVTDAQVQEQVSELLATENQQGGLNNLYFVFLPPNVDECILPDVCGTDAFAGYHSDYNLKGKVVIYAVAIDPLIEIGAIPLGGDPQGNADAEVTVDVAAHETNEAMTDPEGDGWMDPNGYEVADKCEEGPQHGTPLGFATNGSPFDQVINGQQWLLQEIWSNDEGGCVQGTQDTANPLPLPQVNLTQFSSKVTGNIGKETAGIDVTVSLLRQGALGPVVVAKQQAATQGDGGWELTLPRDVGDDRDQIDIEYGPGGPTPSLQVIRTGNGGDPFTESGWTGWTDLDLGSQLADGALVMGPCFQTGVLSYSVDGQETGASGIEGSGSPSEFCGTATDTASVTISPPAGSNTALTASSNDNRTFVPANEKAPVEPNQVGGLVKLTVPIGEPGAVSLFPSDLQEFTPSGFPICMADLGFQEAACVGLVPNQHYVLEDNAQKDMVTANGQGVVVRALPIKGGDSLSLANGARTLTTLHVANLRVHLEGDGATVASGSCTPEEYWGGPLVSEAFNVFAGAPSSTHGGAALTGEICPQGGSAAGLPTSEIGETDESSGGETITQVAYLANTSPVEGETMYGSFTALAEATESEVPIALRIEPAAGGSPSFKAANVDTAKGVTVSGLAPGSYLAIWTVGDASGDTRAVATRFIERSRSHRSRGKRGHRGKAAR